MERLAAFRQIQALSNTIKQLGMWRGIDDFKLPADYRVDAVEAGEVRVLAPAQDHGPDNRNYAVRVRTGKGTAQRVLPDSAFEQWQSHKLLVLNLDQGGVGAAGVAFAQESMQLMVYAHWDKFHRVIRDINLALGRSSSGLFLKTRIFSAHLWSINYKPWGTGLFGTQKQQLLNAFMGTQSPESAIFRKYAPMIATALDRPLDSPEDYTSLFDDIPFLARSFRRALDVAKMGRWFSWNGCASEQLPEFHIQKMLLEHHLDAGPCASAGHDGQIRDPDDCATAFDDLQGAARAKTPQAQLAQLKAANGGFRLAYGLMSSDLYTYSKVLYTVLRPLWSWYVDQVESVKASKHGLAALLALSEGRWMSDPQFAALITNALHCSASLPCMQVAPGNSILSERIVSVTRTLLGQRAWSMAARHHAPTANLSPRHSDTYTTSCCTLQLAISIPCPSAGTAVVHPPPPLDQLLQLKLSHSDPRSASRRLDHREHGSIFLLRRWASPCPNAGRSHGSIFLQSRWASPCPSAGRSQRRRVGRSGCGVI